VYDRLSSEDVLVITSCTARALHKYSYNLHPLREKIGLCAADFLHSGTPLLDGDVLCIVDMLPQCIRLDDGLLGDFMVSGVRIGVRICRPERHCVMLHCMHLSLPDMKVIGLFWGRVWRTSRHENSWLLWF